MLTQWCWLNHIYKKIYAFVIICYFCNSDHRSAKTARGDEGWDDTDTGKSEMGGSDTLVHLGTNSQIGCKLHPGVNPYVRQVQHRPGVIYTFFVKWYPEQENRGKYQQDIRVLCRNRLCKHMD